MNGLRTLDTKPRRTSYVPHFYRQLEEMTQERAAPVDHYTLNHWVIKYALCRVMAAGAKAQEVSHVLMRMAEAGRGREPFELQQRTYALFDGGMALFQEIIRVARRLMADRQCKL